jgi:hypothetical protein
MRDTLETDAFIEGLNDDWDVEFAALTAFAKQLERERDEARDTVLRLRKQRAIARNFGEQMERERDEARRLLATAKESLNAIHVEVGGWIRVMMKEGK